MCETNTHPPRNPLFRLQTIILSNERAVHLPLLKVLYLKYFGTESCNLWLFFILVYVRVEVTIGGWIASFIINVRGDGSSSKYVSSGFFDGLTVGRVALLWVNKKVGQRTVVFIYATLAIV
jgi:fucose permease